MEERDPTYKEFPCWRDEEFGVTLYHGDCLEVMPTLKQVDAIITDPPYGTIKGLNLDNWDEAKTDWDIEVDPVFMFNECERLLRANGPLLLFSQDPYTGKLMTKATCAGLPFSYRYTWLKDNFANALSAKKAPVNYTEDICCFFKKPYTHDGEGYHPNRPYAARVDEYIGKKKREIFEEMGHQGMCHFLRHGSSQFSMCTEDTYAQLVCMYDLDQMPGFISFSLVHQQDRIFREHLLALVRAANPKVFNLLGRKYKSNVLKHGKDGVSHHPTQKPFSLMADLVATYTDPGQTVLDFTMGSGSTGIAAVMYGRKFVGIEKDKGYFDIAINRIRDAIFGAQGGELLAPHVPPEAQELF